MPRPRKLILVVVNKHWECDPVLIALLGEGSAPALRAQWPTLHWPRLRRNPPKGHPPGAPDPDPTPRATYTLGDVTAEVWCISDLLEHLPDEGKHQSSSQRKAERLPVLLERGQPDLVIAVGTSTVAGPANLNGCVVAGTSVFAHNGDPANPNSQWGWTFDTLVQSAVSPEAFASMTNVSAAIVPRLLPTPRAPAAERVLVAHHDHVALATVNVTDYTKYAQADAETLAAFGAATRRATPGSLETTHAVIRATLGDRFVFVSGIVNRLGRFDEDVGGPGVNSSQNFAGAYNTGVCVAWMLPPAAALL
jgi:hypothetical protein